MSGGINDQIAVMRRDFRQVRNGSGYVGNPMEHSGACRETGVPQDGIKPNAAVMKATMVQAPAVDAILITKMMI